MFLAFGAVPQLALSQLFSFGVLLEAFGEGHALPTFMVPFRFDGGGVCVDRMHLIFVDQTVERVARSGFAFRRYVRNVRTHETKVHQ